jgi:hypothetical protein
MPIRENFELICSPLNCPFGIPAEVAVPEAGAEAFSVEGVFPDFVQKQ